MTRFMSIMADFLRSREAATAALTAMAVFILMGFAGMAVDIGIWQATKRSAQVATDAAALAGAHELNKINNPGAPTQADLDMVKAAVTTAAIQNGFDPAVDNIDVALNVTPDGLQAEVLVSKFAPLLFSRVLRRSSPQVGASGTAARISGNLELVLVVDVSRSMRGSRIADLRAAALNMMQVIYGSENTIPKLWVGLVPFGSRVNIEDYGAGWMSGAPGAGQLCVNLRSVANFKNDEPPSVEQFDEFNTEPQRCPGGEPVLFLTDDRSKVDARLTSLGAERGTATWRGAVWGWRMVSEKWKGVWNPAEPDLPNPYNSGVKKFVVIMTDGDNRPDQVPDPWRGSTPSPEYTTAQVDDILVEECNAMKAAGIVVFTVTFHANSQAIRDTYEDCASPGKAYMASNASELHQHFEKIGDLVKSVRLVN